MDPVNHPKFKGKHHQLVTDEFPIIQHSPLIVQTQISCSYSIHMLHEAAFVTPMTCNSAWSNSNSSVRSVNSLDSGGKINCAYSCMHAKMHAFLNIPLQQVNLFGYKENGKSPKFKQWYTSNQLLKPHKLHSIHILLHKPCHLYRAFP